MTSTPSLAAGETFPAGAALGAAVEALLEADTTSTRTRLYQALLEATLLVPLSGLASGDLQGRWRWLADEPLIELAALGAGRLPNPTDPPAPEPAIRPPVAFQQSAADLPGHAKAKLADLLAGLPAVHAAYLFQTGTSAGPAQLAVAVVLAPGSDQQQTDTTMMRLLTSLHTTGNPIRDLSVIALGDGPLPRALRQHVPHSSTATLDRIYAGQTLDGGRDRV